MADDQHQLQQQGPVGHYSEHNKIPNIKQFIEGLDRDKRQRDREIDERQHARAEARSRGEAVPHQAEPRSIKKGTGKTVTDPITGHQVVVEDVDKDMMKRANEPTLSVPNPALGKSAPVYTDSSQSGEEYRHNQDITSPPDPIMEGTTSDVPIHGEKTNILFHPTPTVTFEPTFEALEKKVAVLCLGILIGVIVLGRTFGGSLKGMIPLGACIASAVWLFMKEVIRSGREVEWDSEKTRGQMATANLLPESVEWLNTFLGIAWGLVNPDMFSTVADTLEDVMQASVPGVIENVRVAEINQGSNPIRILSLRALPDSHVADMKKSISDENKKNKDPQEAAADEEGGDFYNLEASFAYNAAPSGKRADDRARNMHMQLVFYLGVKGVVGIPLPIFVELQQLVGTVRIRLNLTPDPPFLKSMAFTLMGVPHVQAGCMPMFSGNINLLNLPLISKFVNYAIGAAASLYVAPKSMMIDMRAILQGDDIQKDVQALGVMWIRIHRAVGLSKQDRSGSKGGGSDPYIVLTFSKYGKPMYCTRVITDDLNPIWEETCALLVTPELIKADENLSVELWDSDRHTADDVVGKVELSMQKMIQHSGKMFPQVSKLAGMDKDSSMPGELHWEVGYFGKPSFRPALRTDGKDHKLDAALKDAPELQDDKGVQNNATDDAVMHTPPDPLWPSGVCSIIVHQIVNLEFQNVKGTEGTRKGREYEPAMPYGEQTDEEGKHLPTSYCTILFNDELVYRTRAKAVSSQPIFNAGTEKFIRDWRSAIVTVTVRDSRNREHDPILGVVPLKLTDVLDTCSQVTRWYPLDGGIGFGRIRISVLFRSIETRLPPHMLGWDVGTFQFTSDRVLAVGYKHHAKLKMRTGGSIAQLDRTQTRSLDEGDGYYWDLVKKDGKNAIKLPVKYRYRSPIVIEFHTAGQRKPDAYAMIWLQDLIDNEETPFNIPIWKTSMGSRLTQNYITEEAFKSGAIGGIDDMEEVGRMHFRGRFTAGMDESHRDFISDNPSRETYETWEACLAEGVRDRKVEKEMPEIIQQLHDESLTEGREVLKGADEEEKKKWLSKDGTDWSGAFSHDPKAYMQHGEKKREPGRDAPLHDPYNPSSDSDALESGDEDFDDDSSEDLGIQDATNMSSSSKRRAGQGSGQTDPNDDALSARDQKNVNAQNKRTEARKHRGIMQWKPARNVKFAADEGKIGFRKLKNKFTGGLEGRQPGVQTETEA